MRFRALKYMMWSEKFRSRSILSRESERTAASHSGEKGRAKIRYLKNSVIAWQEQLLWGGRIREESLIWLLGRYYQSLLINIGVGEDLTIKELAEMVREAVGFEGNVIWDSDQPDGTPRKLLDVSRIRTLGWKPLIDLKRGIREVYDWFRENSEWVRR
jgi:hypothetical protein